MKGNRRLKVREIAIAVHISSEGAYTIFHKHLNLKNLFEIGVAI